MTWNEKDVSHQFMTMILTSVTMVGWADVPDSDWGDFRRRRAVDISSSIIDIHNSFMDLHNSQSLFILMENMGSLFKLWISIVRNTDVHNQWGSIGMSFFFLFGTS